MTEPNGQRVFCVGMNKTGTSSLGRCFSILDLLPVARPTCLKGEGARATRALLQEADCEPALALAERFRSFEDRPWNLPGMYERLDERYPGSLFILTERDPGSWWRSVNQWLTVNKPDMVETYRLHLGLTAWGKDAAIEAFQVYNRSVRDYFDGSGQLLVMDLEQGDGWDTLCAFLGRAIPAASFPHANRQAYSKADRVKLRGVKSRRRKKVCPRCGTAMPKYNDPSLKPSALTRVVDCGINAVHLAKGKVELATTGGGSPP